MPLRDCLSCFWTGYFICVQIEDELTHCEGPGATKANGLSVADPVHEVTKVHSFCRAVFFWSGGTSAQVKAYSAALHSGTMAQMPDVPAVLLSDTEGLRTAQSSASPLPKASCNREDGLRLQAEIYWSMLTCMEKRRGVEAGEWNQKGPGCSFKKIKKRLQEKLSEEFRTRTGSKHQK